MIQTEAWVLYEGKNGANGNGKFKPHVDLRLETFFFLSLQNQEVLV